MSEERVTEALQALRRADRDIGLDGEAEVRTLLKFRRQRRRRRSRRVAMGCALAAALAIAALFRSAPGSRDPIVAAVRAMQIPPAPAAPKSQPAPRPVPRARRKELEEVVTPFFALLPSAPPFERGLLVRMKVPASAMRNVGLPVADDQLSEQVLADVLVGQDDLARAIRFVSYQ